MILPTYLLIAGPAHRSVDAIGAVPSQTPINIETRVTADAFSFARLAEQANTVAGTALIPALTFQRTGSRGFLRSGQTRTLQALLGRCQYTGKSRSFGNTREVSGQLLCGSFQWWLSMSEGPVRFRPGRSVLPCRRPMNAGKVDSWASRESLIVLYIEYAIACHGNISDMSPYAFGKNEYLQGLKTFDYLLCYPPNLTHTKSSQFQMPGPYHN